MASAHQPPHTYSLPPPPNMQNSGTRLPSLKDLNFQYRPPPSQDGPPLSNGAGQNEHSRAPDGWGRQNASSRSTGPPPSHQNSMPPPQDTKSHQYSHQKSEGQYMSPNPASHPPAPSQNGANGGAPPSRSDSSQQPTKRARSGSSVSASPRSHVTSASPTTYSQHTPYSSQPPPPPPASYQAGAPVVVGPPHGSAHPPPQYSHPPGYPPYPPYPPPPQHVEHRQHPMPPPPAPMHQSPPSNSYPAPPPPSHWQHAPHQPPPQDAQHQYAGYPRTTPLVPAPLETRGGPPHAEGDKVTMRQGAISEIVKHCTFLYNFATRYASVQAQPPPPEMQEMYYRATTVCRLLEDLRRLTDHVEGPPQDHGPPNSSSEEHARPPKRPWEDAARDEQSPAPSPYPEYPPLADNMQSIAEQDMEIIRSKRATSTGGNAPGQPKSKYRKRSRATPPGKCHSCNIRETPEWRRGPDGARTLCNACGLHYAKLMRKRERGPDGKMLGPIDMQTLRASTASARGSEPEHGQVPHPHHGSPGLVPLHDAKPHQHPPPHPYPSTPYQFTPPGAGPPPGHQMMPPPPPANHHEPGQINVPPPPPPWLSSSSSASSTASGRSAYTSEHPSYMRSSHHGRASPPR